MNRRNFIPLLGSAAVAAGRRARKNVSPWRLDIGRVFVTGRSHETLRLGAGVQMGRAL